MTDTTRVLKKRELLGRDNVVDVFGAFALAGLGTKMLLKETNGVSVRVGAIAGVSCVAAAYAHQYMLENNKTSLQYPALFGAFVIPTLVAAGVIKLTMSDAHLLEKSVIAGSSCLIAGWVMQMNDEKAK